MGESYGIIVGFQLTPEQLRYNREQMGTDAAVIGGDVRGDAAPWSPAPWPRPSGPGR